MANSDNDSSGDNYNNNDVMLGSWLDRSRSGEDLYSIVQPFLPWSSLSSQKTSPLRNSTGDIPYASQIETIPTYGFDSRNSQPYTGQPNPSVSPLEEVWLSFMRTQPTEEERVIQRPVSPISLEPRSAHRDEQLLFMPTPTLPSASSNNQESLNLINEPFPNFFSSHNLPVYTSTDRHIRTGQGDDVSQNPIENIVHYDPALLYCSTPQYTTQFLSSSYGFNNTHLNPSARPSNVYQESREPFSSYLSRQTRHRLYEPIYKCHICNTVFPTGQAYGGHMSAHSKAERMKALMEAQAEGQMDSGGESSLCPSSQRREDRKEGGPSSSKKNYSTSKSGNEPFRKIKIVP